MASSSYWPPSTDISDSKYLNVPYADTTDEFANDQSRARQDSSLRFNRIISCAVTFAALSATAICIILHYHPFTPTHHSDQSTCYVAPSCGLMTTNPVTGFTNATGWIDGSTSSMGTYCCDICSAHTEAPVVALGALGDGWEYDFLLFDQIWLPQYCNAFTAPAAHDPTLSHLSGTQCTDEILSGPTRLSIHGLWPQRFNASNFCCAGTPSVNPLIPSLVQQWPIFVNLTTQWTDPSTDAVEDGMTCSTCYLLNHEWQKHGTCFGSYYEAANEVELQKAYFTSGLSLHSTLQGESSAVAALVGQVVPVSQISSFYGQKVNVMCDPQATYDGHLRTGKTAVAGAGLGDAAGGAATGPRAAAGPAGGGTRGAGAVRAATAATGVSTEGGTSGRAVAPVGGTGSAVTTGVFLEIQTCWNMSVPTPAPEEEPGSRRTFDASFIAIDCPDPTANGFTAPCPEFVYIPPFV